MAMTWHNCFSGRRFGMENEERGIRTEYERDWDRLIFSSPFRRLQNKTQVFPLPGEVFVHNRLTHSLEVASVGRSLGKLVGKELSYRADIKENEDSRRFYRNHLKNVIASACLAHDLGNPAFGHSGEDAISKYFKDRETESDCDIQFKAQFSAQEWADLTSFEGNANSLRVLTKSLPGRFPGGFRLTYSTLGAIIKYPCESRLMKSNDTIHTKKYGYFKIDEKIFLAITKELNMVEDVKSEGISFYRHPFVYLVEAADDICYNIIDFEDAHRLGIIHFEFAVEEFLKIIALKEGEDIDRVRNNVAALKNDPNEALAYLRAKAINALTYRCFEVFMKHEKEILEGEFHTSLIDADGEMKAVMKAIEKTSYEKIYNYREVVKIELAGFEVMSGLIKDFVEAVLKPKDLRIKRENKIVELLPTSYRPAEDASPYNKVMHVIDYISGMTDLFALKLYRNIKGIELPQL